MGNHKDDSWVLDAVERAINLNNHDKWQSSSTRMFEIAEAMGIETIPSHLVVDTALLTDGDRHIVKYNPNRRASRITFSLAKEIAKVIIWGCENRPKYEEDSFGGLTYDDWAVTIAASALLMPARTEVTLEHDRLTMSAVNELRKKYSASCEAFLLWLAHTKENPLTVFSASTPLPNPEGYRCDYLYSKYEGLSFGEGSSMAFSAAVTACTGIMHIVEGDEGGWSDEAVHVSCIGIPGPTDSYLPRVIGFLRPINTAAEVS